MPPFFFKVFIKFEGQHAQFRITNSSPVFEVTLPGNWVPGEHVKLVKLDIEKERRELPVQGMAGPGVPIKPKKATAPLSFAQMSKENTAGMELAVYRAQTVGLLQPTEYVLAIDQTYYCFGVDRAK